MKPEVVSDFDFVLILLSAYTPSGGDSLDGHLTYVRYLRDPGKSKSRPH